MQIFVNDRERNIPGEPTILNVLEQENITSLKGIAVAINGFVLPKDEWNEKKVKEGNQILIIKAAQGG